MALTATDLDLIPDDQMDDIFLNSKITRSRWRRCGLGPKFVKIGRRIFYRRSELELWLSANGVQSSSEGRMLKDAAACSANARRQISA